MSQNPVITHGSSVHHASHLYRNLIDENGFLRSMSRKGDCWDTNSPAAVRRAIDDLKNLLESRLPCRKDTFIAVRRIRNDEVHAYGKLWE